MTTPVFSPCARCGANINPHGIRAQHKDGRTLDFCGHHGREHGKALEVQKWTITPVSVLLEGTPTGGYTAGGGTALVKP